MKIDIIPKSILGKVSAILLIIMPIFLFIGMKSVVLYEGIQSGRTILQDIILRPGIALPMLAAFISGISAFVTGMTGIIRKKDHSVIIFLSTTMGFFVLLWVLAEILFPH
ncbi:hypothetical protein GF351_06495 [Candidatus Woesearchaeota archaeon]|nr:hypothetical protein [Candidatus Woesearchaeota archaeon]